MNAAQVQALIRMGLPMAEDIDFRVERLDERHALARIPFHGKLVRPGGTLSGPTIMALADAAMYAVILGRLGAVEMAVTSNLNINFLSKPRPEDLLAEASILKLGRRQVVCEVGCFRRVMRKTWWPMSPVPTPFLYRRVAAKKKKPGDAGFFRCLSVDYRIDSG